MSILKVTVESGYTEGVSDDPIEVSVGGNGNMLLVQGKDTIVINTTKLETLFCVMKLVVAHNAAREEE